jgi:hypothetical protein
VLKKKPEKQERFGKRSRAFKMLHGSPMLQNGAKGID